jgi:predicted phage baseplate assembly protein
MNEPCGCHATNQPCGCCAGVDPQTPAETANPPGLDALRYRIGTHAAFLETMKARLASHALPPADPDAEPGRPLAQLTARRADDPAIAMFDAWATVADVLTFYQERIANEGYLRTATERRSILELARLVGYNLRPGVAASVYLAYELEQPQPAASLPGQASRSIEQRTMELPAEVVIPAGSRAQSTPGPGERPQSFETSHPLTARAVWNNLRPRLSRAQNLQAALSGASGVIYLKGVATNLKPNDPLLIVLAAKPRLFRVVDVQPDSANDRTMLALEQWESVSGGSAQHALLRSIARHYANLELFGIRAGGKITKRVLEQLGKLQSADLSDAARDDVLANLRRERDNVRKQPLRSQSWAGSYETWLSGMVGELEQALGVSGDDDDDRGGRGGHGSSRSGLSELIRGLELPPTLPPSSRAALSRQASRVFDPESDSSAQILSAIRPAISRTLYDGWRNLPVTPSSTIEVYALRVRASIFGHNAPLRTGVRRSSNDNGELSTVEYNEWTPQIIDPDADNESPGGGPIIFAAGPSANDPQEQIREVTLDAPYAQILPGGWVVLERSRPITQGQSRLVITRAADVAERSRADYGMSAKGAQLRLNDPWLAVSDNQQPNPMLLVRGTAVYAGAELLELVEQPIDDPVADDEIELGDLYDGLEAGRWLIVAGERADLAGVDGVRAAELVMLSGVRQGFDPDLPGDRSRTTLQLATPLSYAYKRDTAIVYGNVAHATHGETRPEALGSGNGAQPIQQFTLRQPPLTFVSAPTVDGVESTLEVFVNDVRWHEAPSLWELGPTDRGYITRTDDDQRTSVIFGNGEHGARPATGRENIRAVYRTGIGAGGNVGVGAITLLTTRPLGVKGVVNPLAASGGADRESRDQARANAPLGVTALDRLVSVRDYEDFARTFAGIGKASAQQLSDGRREVVHLTIAGVDDAPIALTSDLYRNLRLALHRWGDPHLPIVVALRELVALIISANVRVHPDYLWDVVEPQIRAALLERLGFARRALGQDALLSEAITAIQAVAGVEYVDVDLWGGVPELRFNARGRSSTPTPEQISDQIRRLEREQRPPAGPPARTPIGMARIERGALRAAQLGVLLPAAPDTILLRRLP